MKTKIVNCPTSTCKSTKVYRFITSVAAILLIIFLGAATAIAQNEQAGSPTQLSNEAPSLRFKHIGLNEGLAQSSIQAIMQDSAGFIWIGTQNGLQRYDGHSFKTFTSTPFDTTSLSGSWIWGVAQASNGKLWVTVDGGGLNLLDPATGHATQYHHDPKDSTSLASDNVKPILKARNGDLWVATANGLDRMPANRKGHFIHYRYDPSDSTTLTNNFVLRLTQSPEGTIWAGTYNGVSSIDPQTGKVTRYLNEPGINPNAPVGEHTVYKPYFPPNEPDIVWLPTDHGLVRLNTHTGAFKRFLPKSNNDAQNSSNKFYNIVPDPDDSAIFWINSASAGLLRFDTRSQTFTGYRRDPQNTHSLSGNFVMSLMVDRSGMMWAGTAGNGLNVFNPGAINFTNVRHRPGDPRSLAPGAVYVMHEDHSGRLWVGTVEGQNITYLTSFDPERGTINRYRPEQGNPHSLQPGPIYSIAEDPSGNIWAGHVYPGGGLSRINPETGRVQRFNRKKIPKNARGNNIVSLLPTLSDPNIFWVGTAAGLQRFDTRTGRFSPVPLHLQGTADQSLFIASLYQDSVGGLWIGTTNKGLLHYTDGQTRRVAAYDPADSTTINSNFIADIKKRKGHPHVLWLATLSGLNRLDLRTQKVTHYREKDGLANNTVYGILEDARGTLWMSTNRGISNFDPETQTFRNYGLEDGLMALEFNQGGFAKGHDGELYFGSEKGITAFKPANLHTNDIPPQVAFTGLSISNKPVTPGPDSPLKKPLAETDSLVLDHDQNKVTFNFVALHYANPDKNTYAYQLQGFDNDWVQAGTRHQASYINLPPGDYTFRVKAANADGVWNEKGASLQLTVLPPWWRTWWAYGLWAILLGAVIFGTDRIQRRRLAKKERERAKLREAELRAEAENKRRADTEQLSEIGRAITSTLSVEQIINTIYKNVNALMDAAIFGVGIYNKKNDRLDFPATKEKGQMLAPYSYGLDEEDRLAVWCFNNQEEVIIGNYEQELQEYLSNYEPPKEGEDPVSILYLPLMQQDRTIGVITTQSFEREAYSAYHINLLRNLATYAAIALDNAAAYRRLNATLSELQSMQQQLVQQEKLASLGQLTAGIAHEIKNPLNFVNNFSELSVELIEEAREELQSEKANGKSKKVEEALEILNDIEMNLKKIHEHGSRADSIVKSMLEHSRGGSGKMELTDLNGLVKEFVNLSFHGMRASKNPINVEIDFQFDDSIGEVPLIAEDFSRVIVNLCNNAFDAMREKLINKDLQGFQNLGGLDSYSPKLTVRTHQIGNTTTIEIQDNGPGIPEEMKDKIMQPFFTTKKGTQGTGLGLSITNDIIKAHGGQLEIETGEGNGSVFVVSLPTV